MFNKEFVSSIMDTYQCNQVVVNKDGQVFALRPEGQLLIPGFMFDTDSVDGTVTKAVVAEAAKK